MALLNLNKIVEVLNLSQFILEDLPSRLQNFHHNIVVNVIDKMRHLLMRQVKAVESVFHAWNFVELIGVCKTKPPGGAQTVVNSLKLP